MHLQPSDLHSQLAHGAYNAACTAFAQDVLLFLLRHTRGKGKMYELSVNAHAQCMAGASCAYLCYCRLNAMAMAFCMPYL